MSHDTRPPSPTKNLIAEAIKASFAHERVLFSTEVQTVIEDLIPPGDPKIIVPLVHMFTAPEGIHRLFALIDRVSLEILWAAYRELPRLLERRSNVHALIADSDFACHSPSLKAELCAYESVLDQRIISILQPIKEAWERIRHEQPEIRYLEPWPKEQGGKTQPETLFMVLLAEHFRQQTTKPHYKKIAKAVNVLFPQQRKKGPLTAKRVQDRVLTFRPENK